MDNFKNFSLPPEIVNGLVRMKYENPTPIQSQAIPYILEGRDILGTAQTGTGKTAAFTLPILAKLMEANKGSALILTPTRELAIQVMDFVNNLLGGRSKIRKALLVGGEYIGKQFNQLRSFPRLIIGTPGRVNDHLERKTLKLDDIEFLVIDEVDRMLDMGFDVQIEAIINQIPKKRQTLMFSATLPQKIIRLTAQYLINPQRVSIGSTDKPIIDIKQDVLHVVQKDKYSTLLSELETRQGSIIIFVQTKIGVEKLSDKLRSDNQNVDYLHGDLRQSRRERVIRGFRNKKFRILVATDVAARGLDIPHIEHVINFDLPQCPEDYIHRIGRTARAGAEGSSLALITPQDNYKWNEIQKFLHPEKKIERTQKRNDFKKNHSKSSIRGFEERKKHFSPSKKYSEKKYSDGKHSKNSKPYSR